LLAPDKNSAVIQEKDKIEYSKILDDTKLDSNDVKSDGAA